MEKTKEFQIVEEKETAARKVSMHMMYNHPSSLEVLNVTTTYRVKYQLHHKTGTPVKVLEKIKLDETVQNSSYPLVEISAQQLAELRARRVPSFLLKNGNHLYHAEIPEDLSLVAHEIIGPHRCAVSGHVCDHLSAASDEDGGCALVREFSRNIENYPWITHGFETFGTKTEVTSVKTCSHYQPCAQKKLMSRMERDPIVLNLAQYIWPDVDNIKEVRERIRKNLSNKK